MNSRKFIFYNLTMQIHNAFFISSLNVTEFTIDGITDGVSEESSLFVGTCEGDRDCMADGISLICAVGVTDGLM